MNTAVFTAILGSLSDQSPAFLTYNPHFMPLTGLLPELW